MIKYIQNIPTEDCLTLMYAKSGELRYAYIGEIGAFDGFEFDLEKAEKSIQDKLLLLSKKYNVTVTEKLPPNPTPSIKVAPYGVIYLYSEVEITQDYNGNHGSGTLPLFTKLK